MSLNDLFRSLFGFNKGPYRQQNRDKDESDSIWLDDSPEGGDMEDVFSHFHGDMQTQVEELHRQMEDMFKNFGVVDFPAVFQPSIEQDASSPRDHMLKDKENEPRSNTEVVPTIPHHDSDVFKKPSIFGGMFTVPRWDRIRPQDKVDQDLDGKVESKDIAKLFEKSSDDKNKHEVMKEEPRFFPHHNSISVRTIIGADGKVEQRKTVRDSSGNEETIITRSLGDKSHTITSKQDSRGVQEHQEKFENMDEKDLSSFDEHWKKPDPNKPADPRENMSVRPGDGIDDNASLFNKLFSDIWKSR